MSRRVVLGAGGAALLGALTGCGEDEEPAAPTETPVPEPTATQEPIASPVASYLNPERWVGRTLTIASLGGDYQDAQEAAYFEPFALATGATIQQNRSVEIGELTTQVDRGTVTWDVVCLPMNEALALARDDYLEPIDYAMVDRSVLLDQIVGQYSVGADLFSTVIVYAADAPQPPAGWRDFWLSPVFDEGRSLRKLPVGTLEFALLADSVPMSDLYPLQVDRAFASLERIRAQVVQWWEDGKQPVELVAADQAGLASAWNVRADLPDVREAVVVQWREGMLSANAWMVPRGSANLKVAMDFINYATRAVPQANFAQLLPYGPVNTDAFQHLRPERLRQLPSAEPQLSQQFFENWNYWIDNREVLEARFLEWVTTDPEPTATAD